MWESVRFIAQVVAFTILLKFLSSSEIEDKSSDQVAPGFSVKWLVMQSTKEGVED